MNPTKYQCPNCQQSEWHTYSTLWICQHCSQEYTCLNGIPRLYLESALGKKDKELRDKFYNGFLGTYYQYVMPFLSLPARPVRAYWKGWRVYFLIVLTLIGMVYLVIPLPAERFPSIAQATVLLLLITLGLFFSKHP